MDGILKNGITGFTDQPTALVRQDPTLFMTIIPALLNGRVEWQDIDLVGKNYYWYLVASEEQQLSFFLNAYYPLAAVRIEAPQQQFGYLTTAQLSEQYPLLASFSYEVLGREMLDEDIAPQDFLALNAAEMQRVNLWKPRTYEEILFNNWD